MHNFFVISLKFKHIVCVAMNSFEQAMGINRNCVLTNETFRFDLLEFMLIWIFNVVYGLESVLTGIKGLVCATCKVSWFSLEKNRLEHKSMGFDSFERPRRKKMMTNCLNMFCDTTFISSSSVAILLNVSSWINLFRFAVFSNLVCWCTLSCKELGFMLSSSTKFYYLDNKFSHMLWCTEHLRSADEFDFFSDTDAVKMSVCEFSCQTSCLNFLVSYVVLHLHDSLSRHSS